MAKEIMYEKIYNDLKNQIESGKLKAGDKLPTEMELAKQYGVSRITSKRAMDTLAAQDYIIKTAGKGSFVKLYNTYLTANDVDLKRYGDPNEEKRVIGVILDNIGLDFGTHILKGIEDQCHKAGFVMLVQCTYGIAEEENNAIRRAINMGVKGIIMMCALGENYNDILLRLALEKFPIILVDRQLKGIPIPCIKTDNRAAAKKLTEILIEHGHKKICFVTHSRTNTPTIDERYQGFMEAVMEHADVTGMMGVLKYYETRLEDFENNTDVIDGGEIHDLVCGVNEYTAFLAAEYKIGALIKRVIRKNGMDKEVVAFDGLPAIYQNENDITHIRQSETKMGIGAVKMLDKLLKNEKVDPIVYLPYKLYREGECE